MQAITTKFIPATNTKGSRIKATCSRGLLTIIYPLELSTEEAHILAAQKLCEKFAGEDLKQYGTPISKNPWLRVRVVGETKTGFHHVFIESNLDDGMERVSLVLSSEDASFLRKGIMACKDADGTIQPGLELGLLSSALKHTTVENI